MDRINRFFTFCGLFLLASAASARAFVLYPDPPQIGGGTEQEVTVRLNTEGEAINALEGSLRLPDGITVRGVSDANSVVGLWMDRPEVRERSLAFSGLIPGGYSGKDGILFTLIVEGELGSRVISPERFEVYANDGRGTLIASSSAEMKIEIGEVPNPAPDADRDPPERFSPEVVRDPDIEGGKFVLLFSTQDKGSGMDHYEIMEVPSAFLSRPNLTTWERATSPYVLKDQTGGSKLLVRAVDRAGNFLIVTVPAGSRKSPIFYVILGGILICLIIISRFLRRKRVSA